MLCLQQLICKEQKETNSNMEWTVGIYEDKTANRRECRQIENVCSNGRSFANDRTRTGLEGLSSGELVVFSSGRVSAESSEENDAPERSWSCYGQHD